MIDRCPPDDAALRRVSCGLALLKRMSVSAPLCVFRDQFALPYYTPIRTRDLLAFTSPTFMIVGFDDVCDSVRRLADSMSAADLVTMWDRFNVLVDMVVSHMALGQAGRNR
jgi:hypothetical protein